MIEHKETKQSAYELKINTIYWDIFDVEIFCLLIFITQAMDEILFKSLC